MGKTAWAFKLEPARQRLPLLQSSLCSVVTPEKLAQVEKAEAALRVLGFRELRVRHHDQIARIEVSQNELARAVEHSDQITTAMKEAGFPYATLDLAGFRSGSMNDVLRKK